MTDIKKPFEVKFTKRVPFNCPICGSDEIEGKLSDVTEENLEQVVFQECSCMFCESEWMDKYVLQSTTVFDKNKDVTLKIKESENYEQKKN